MADWPKCPRCGEMLVFDKKNDDYLCPKCKLLYQLDRGRVMGPLIPTAGTGKEEEKTKQPGKLPPHAGLDREELEDFFRYLDASGPGRESYRDSGRGVKKGMLDSWIKMGKPSPKKRKVSE